MRIYEKPRRKKRTTLCSYCGGIGHLWITCPYPKIHVEQIQKGSPIDTSVYRGNQLKWAFKINQGTGLVEPRTKWLENNAKQCLAKQLSRSEKIYHFGKRTKSKRRCGFCASPSHNRKNCKVMKGFIEDLAIANQNYRQQFFDTLVEHHGISEGALVMVRKGGKRNNGQMEKELAIIQHIDWDSINLTLDCKTREFSGDFGVSVIVDGETWTSNTPFWYWLDEEYDYPHSLSNLIAQNTYDDKFQILEVLSESNEKPSKKWFLEGYDNCWKWICKNRSLFEIGGVFADLIEKHCPALKAKRGLEARLKRYRKK